MKKTCFAFCLFLAQAAHAEDCTQLGIENDYLQKMFCAELDEIIDADPISRGIGGDDDPDSDTDNLFEGLGIDAEVFKKAYRADPSATLELIERIRQAGGLLNQ